jgi:putative membrane protein
MIATENKSEKPLDKTTELAYDRTRLACERNMLSWVRTAISLITFGFTIYQVFKLKTVRAQEEPLFIGPTQFSLLLVSIGLIALILATMEHRQQIQILGADSSKKSRSLAVAFAALIAALGTVAFAVMVFRP